MLKRVLLILVVVAVGSVCLALPSKASKSHDEAAVPELPSMRVGTFKSRAVAVAFYRSEVFQRELQDLMAEAETAEKAGNAEKRAELEARGTALQAAAHRQSFGGAPIPDVLERIKDALPELARVADVQVIVSGVVYQAPSVELVDVTDSLVAQFNPDEMTLKVIERLLERPPIPEP